MALGTVIVSMSRLVKVHLRTFVSCVVDPGEGKVPKLSDQAACIRLVGLDLGVLGAMEVVGNVGLYVQADLLASVPWIVLISAPERELGRSM